MNILIVKMSAIGDVIHTLPALNAIRNHYPHAHITWLVEEDASALVKGHPALDRVLVSKRKRWVKGLLGRSAPDNARELYRFVKELRDTRYDLIIDFQGLIKSGVLIGLSRGARKVGFGRGMEHQEGSYLFLNERIPAVDMDNHALLRSKMLLDALGIPSNDIEYNLPMHDEDRERVNRLLERHGIQNPGLLVAINPVAKWATKLWGNSKFAELADGLVERYGAEVVFTGSQADRRGIQDIISIMARESVNLAGKTSLTVLAALFEKVDFLVSTDTGPMHMAAALETPVVALFGPTAPWRTGPFGPNHQVVRVGMECSPCFKRQCESVVCMEQLSVEQVFGGINKLAIVQSLRIHGTKGRGSRTGDRE
ncbi:MAG: lipopolysaccharide heptosyltransferase I [Deltaproteobacteria bacterium]|nr:MAG: lipopolysaccharide heptosyltransferase I [Deltaproteobacteria bacterium]